jgi:hypothetical protein
VASASRIVRRLRLRAESESAVHRGALLLEDAMRTASLPDAGGRIVLVRRLRLGRIDPRAPPQTIALALERGVARVRPEVVYADSDAPRAPAVWFRDALDAHTRLALRVAAGEPVEAWYWPLAVRAWRPRTPVAEGLRAIALSLARLPEAPSALPRWAAALSEAGHAERLVAALRIEDVGTLAQAAKVPGTRTIATARPPAGTSSDGVQRLAAERPGLASAGLGTRPSAIVREPDSRRMLVEALIRAVRAASSESATGSRDGGAASNAHPSEARARLAADRNGPAGVASSDPPEHSRSGRRSSVVAPPGLAYADPPRRSRGAHVSPAPSPRARHAGPARARSRIHEPARAEGGATELAAPTPRLRERAEVGRAGPLVQPPFGGVATEAGGLLLLIPVLARAGYPEWLEAHPEWVPLGIVPRAFAIALARLRVAAEDPIWAFAGAPPSRRAVPRRFVAPARWRDGLCNGQELVHAGDDITGHTLWDASGRLLLGAWTGACPRALLSPRRRAAQATRGAAGDLGQLVARAWLVAVRRWLRRYARIGLADLVMRPAALASTPTHVDLRFDPVLADLRVRRTGLDFNPGWVPWLARVVTFQYGR